MPHQTNDQTNSQTRPPTQGNDIQGLNILMISAIISLTRIIESVHHRVNRVSGVFGHPAQEHTSGIPGAVYKSVRMIAAAVGKSLDIPLKVIGNALAKKPNTPAIKALRAALNGILGDYLAAQHNPLAIEMHFTHDSVELDQQGVAAVVEKAITLTQGRILLMVHGLCMNGQQWNRNGHDHGTLLAKELNYTPIYLNYNSGQHTSQNGKDLSDLFESMVTHASAPISFSILAHSMGGLVSRSAHHYAKQAGYGWPDALKTIVFLGTPHHGAPLEKSGNWLDFVLAKHPYTTPFARLIQIRSSGITDLRHGNVVEADWQVRNRFDFVRDNRAALSLPEDVECFAVAASMGGSSRHTSHAIIGDGLVPVDSALGQHTSKEYTLQFKPNNLLHVKNVNHLQLLDHPEIFATLRNWLSQQPESHSLNK